MKLEGFEISGYRSFGEEPVKIEGLSKINFFLGKNNAGKSNVLKFIQLLSIALKNPENLRNSILLNQDDFFLLKQEKPIEVKILLKLEQSEQLAPYLWPNFNDNHFWIKYALSGEALIPIDNIFSHISSKEYIKIVEGSSNRRYSSLPDASEVKRGGLEFSHLLLKQLRNLLKVVYLIEPFRQISSGQGNEYQINGKALISKLNQLKNPKVGAEKEREKYLKLQQFVQETLNDSKIEIDIPHEVNEIIINNGVIRLPLDHYGTGIYQLIILASALTIYENCIFCIEEPEIHFHPELQRRFLKYIADNTHNTYFISTHSNVFLDENVSSSVFHVRLENGASQITKCDASNHIFDVLNDLGARASDILQSNCVIFVEGPSDRILINRWIELKDSRLKEGVHYSIMFYGGKLLSHLTIDLPENVADDLIKLLRLNRNAILVMDSDKASSQKQINQTKLRIRDEAGKHALIWLTDGREIENYLSNKLVNKVFQDTIDPRLKIKTHSFRNLHKSLLDAAKSIGYSLKEGEKYENKKVQYCRDFASNMTNEEFKENKELNAMIYLIVSTIKKANGIE